MKRQLDGKQIVKEIVVPGKLVNLVDSLSRNRVPGGRFWYKARRC